MDDSNEIPRRIDILRQTPIEAAIRAARCAVEAGPAHPHMTRATVLLGQALDAVADFVDQVPEKPQETPSNAAAAKLKKAVDFLRTVLRDYPNQPLALRIKNFLKDNNLLAKRFDGDEKKPKTRFVIMCNDGYVVYDTELREMVVEFEDGIDAEKECNYLNNEVACGRDPYNVLPETSESPRSAR